MTLHGLPTLGTGGRLAPQRVGHDIHLVLQGLQHERPVLQFHFTLQQHELRDFLLQSGTLRCLRGLGGRDTRLTLFGQEPPAFRGLPPRQTWGRTVEPSGQAALVKTEISITVLGRKVQQKISNAGGTGRVSSGPSPGIQRRCR